MTTPRDPDSVQPAKAPAAGTPSGAKLGYSLSCRDCSEFLVDYLDGVLLEAQRSIFDAHLKVCPNCVTFMENYQAVSKLAAGTGRTLLAPPVVQDVPPQIIDAILKARLSAPSKGG